MMGYWVVKPDLASKSGHPWGRATQGGGDKDALARGEW